MLIQKILLPQQAGTTLLIQEPHTALHLDFDQSLATFARVDNSLTMTFDSGGSVAVEDFFVTDGSSLPPFILSNGEQVLGEDFLRSMNPDMELETAAGPSGATAGSGLNDYGDGAGNLLAGIDDKLDSLDGFEQWNRTLTARDFSLTPTVAVVAIDGDATPYIPNIDYKVRAILSTAHIADAEAQFYFLKGGEKDLSFRNNSDLSEIKMHLMHGGGSIPISLADSNLINVNADGSVSLSFEAYQEFLTQNGIVMETPDEYGNVTQYFSITDTTGNRYTMQFVVNDTGSYDSRNMEPFGELHEEWHSANGDIHTTTQISSSDGDDVLNVGNLFGKTTIDMRDGDNTLNLGRMYAFQTNYRDKQITAENGDNIINIAVAEDATEHSEESAILTGWGVRHGITTGAGNDILTITGGSANTTTGGAKGIWTPTGGETRVNLGDGDNTLTVRAGFAGLCAAGNKLVNEKLGERGYNYINFGDGNDTLDISDAQHGLWASGGGKNIIDLGDGNNTVNLSADKTLFSYTRAHSSITAGDGDDVFTLTGKESALYSYNYSSNSLNLGNGNNTLHIKSDNNALEIKSYGANNITTGNGSDTLTIDGSLFITGTRAFFTDRDRHNHILTGEGEDVVSINGDLHVEREGFNIIDTGLGDDTVLITGNLMTGTDFTVGDDCITGKGDNFFSSTVTLKDSPVTSQNIIRTGDGNDRVSIVGNLVGGGASSVYVFNNTEPNNHLHKPTPGANTIDTGTGNDIVSIVGDLKLHGYGENIIDTGIGSDILSLDGVIESKNALKLNMGNARGGNDYDTLILTSGGEGADIADRFGQWLEGGGLKGANVEHLHIRGENVGETSELYSYLQEGFVPSNTHITYSVDNTFYLDNANMASLSLSDFLDVQSPQAGAVLDFSGGKENSFNLDSLLGLDSPIPGLTIKGDTNDKVTVSEVWEGSVSDTEGYYSFTRGEHSINIHESMLDLAVLNALLTS